VSLETVIGRLDALIEATPAPPPSDDPAAVIEAFTTIASARAAVLVDLAVSSQDVAHEPAVRERLAVLVARDEAWLSALQHAQTVVAERIGVNRRAARAYGA
jgi:hypothetical protein